MSEIKDKYINPLTDFGFKKLFGTEPNKELLIDFLNQLLPDRKIRDLTYSSNEKQGLTEIDRKAIFDLYCIGVDGERFIVEMQKAKQNYFKDRSIYYASFSVQEQGTKNKWDYKLGPVYSIGILDFIFSEHKDQEDLYHLVELKDQHCEIFYDKLKFIYVELPKFKKQEHELKSQFDKWLYVLTHLSQLEDRPKKLRDRVFKKLFEVAEIAKFTPTERAAYEESLKYYRDIKNVVDTSREEGLEEGLQQGREEGLQKGREEGLQKGREEGLQKGREERNLEIARSMKAKNFSIDEIKTITGMNEKSIKDL